MDYHYSPLQAVFDGWILLLLIALTVLAVVRLRGRRRVLVGVGFGLWSLATVFWMPVLLGRIFEPMAPLIGYELAWQLPLIPWLIGAVLIALGVFLSPVRGGMPPGGVARGPGGQP